MLTFEPTPLATIGVLSKSEEGHVLSKSSSEHCQQRSATSEAPMHLGVRQKIFQLAKCANLMLKKRLALVESRYQA